MVEPGEGASVAEVLAAKADDVVVWLGTVAPDGRPTIRPVWFVVQDGALVLFSTPDAGKVRHVVGNPEVVLTFHTDPAAAHVRVLHGRAEVTLDGPPASSVPGYLAKYEALYADIGHDRDGVDRTYPARLTITPTRTWGW